MAVLEINSKQLRATESRRIVNASINRYELLKFGGNVDKNVDGCVIRQFEKSVLARLASISRTQIARPFFFPMIFARENDRGSGDRGKGSVQRNVNRIRERFVYVKRCYRSAGHDP